MDYKQEIIESLYRQGKGTGEKNLYLNLSPELKADRDIAMAAISTDTYALVGLPSSLKQDKSFLHEAVKQVAEKRKFSFDNACGEIASVAINRDLHESKEFALHVLENNGSLNRFSTKVTWFLDQYPRSKHADALTAAIVLEKNNIRVGSNTEVFSTLQGLTNSKDLFANLRNSLNNDKPSKALAI